MTRDSSYSRRYSYGRQKIARFEVYGTPRRNIRRLCNERLIRRLNYTELVGPLVVLVSSRVARRKRLDLPWVLASSPPSWIHIIVFTRPIAIADKAVSS